MSCLKGPRSRIISRHSFLICVQSIGLFFTIIPERTGRIYHLKKNQNAPRPSEQPPVTIAEAEFLLQKYTKAVDHHPYRTNPRAQEVIDKCVESMESDDIIEKSPSVWRSPVCIVAKADGSPHFCVNYRTTIKVPCTRDMAYARYRVSYRYSRWREIHHCL